MSCRIKEHIEDNLSEWIDNNNEHILTIDELETSMERLFSKLLRENKKLVNYEVSKSWGNQQNINIRIVYYRIPKASNFSHYGHEHAQEEEKDHTFEVSLQNIMEVKEKKFEEVMDNMDCLDDFFDGFDFDAIDDDFGFGDETGKNAFDQLNFDSVLDDLGISFG